MLFAIIAIAYIILENNMNSNEVSELLTQIRKKLNVSQEELAKRLEVSFSTLNRWENQKNVPRGKIKSAILKLAEEAGLSDSEISENNEDKYLETKFYIDGVEIHCVSADLNTLRGKNPLEEAILVERNGIKVLCMPLESELRFYKGMDRDKDKIKIKSLEEKLAKT